MAKKKNIDMIIIKGNITLKESMRVIDNGGVHTALIVDNDKKMRGIITDGDIKRAIQRGVDCAEMVDKVMNREYKHAFVKSNVEKVKSIIIDNFITGMPLLDEHMHPVDFLLLDRNKQLLYYNKRKRLEHRLQKVLVIGGGGYIGSVLVRKLLKKGYKVTILDKFIYGKESVADLKGNPNVRIIEGDTRHIEDVSNAISDADSVVHLAELVGDPAAALNPQLTQQVNYLATRIIAGVCKYYQINRLVYASSCSVYGASKNNQLLDESSTPNPISLYAKMKVASEDALKELQDQNFQPTILRFATLFGVSNRPRFDLVINTLTAKAVKEKKITIFGGNQWRPNVHVADVASSIIAILEAPISVVGGQVFNVGSESNNYTINKIGEMIKSAVPEAEIINDECKQDMRDYKVSFSKLNKVINKKKWISIAEGIKEIKKCLQKHPKLNYQDRKYSNIKFLGEENNPI